MIRRWVATLVALVVLHVGPAGADAVVSYAPGARLPEGTVAVVDPVVGSSPGTPGEELRLAAGDIVQIRIPVTPLPATAVRGIQSYVTVYLPAGTELVGARILDATGNVVEPRRAGLALDGCSGGAACNPAPTGKQTGSIAQLYADTGVFYTTASLAGTRTPEDVLLTMDNGIAMIPSPARIEPEMTDLLGASGGTYHAHDPWDLDQVQAFGTTSSTVSDGDGNTPYGYGSPVAGPDTHYRYEVTGTSLTDVIGPWERIAYPGSQIGTGVGGIGATANRTRVGIGTSAGWDLTPANPVAAKAVRFALGEARVGDVRFVEVALRATSVPIDPAFAPAGGNVLCAETLGGAISSKTSNAGGDTNPWPHYIPHPRCALLRAKIDVEVDRVLALAGDTLEYTLSGRNLSTTDETNVRIGARFATSDQAFASASPAPDSNAPCPSPEEDRTCLAWNLGTLAPGDPFRIVLALSGTGSAATRHELRAEYRSDELDAIEPTGATAAAVTVVRAVAAPRLSLANANDPTTGFAVAGSSTWTLQGPIANDGTANWTQDSLTPVLPIGWSVAGGRIRIAGVTYNCTSGCATNAPTFTVPLVYVPGQERTLAFEVTVPAGTPPGNYGVGVRSEGSQSGIGPFETDVSKAVEVPVGAVRTQPPVLFCPIEPAASSVSGTSEPNAAVEVLLDRVVRGSATADASGLWTASVAGFGNLYPGVETRVTAQAPGKLRGEPSAACTVGRVLPGEIPSLALAPAAGGTDLSWPAPATGGDPAGFRYDVLRTADPADFAGAGTCVESGDGPETVATDPEDPLTGAVFFYRVRARNLWGVGPLGRDSSGLETVGRDCP